MPYTDHIGGANPPPPLSNTDQMAYANQAEIIRCADGSSYYVAGWLSPIAKVNLAQCAARRAAVAGPQDLFLSEYEACRSWTLRSFAVHV